MNKQPKDCTEYVQQTAELMGLTLTPEYLSGVIANFHSLVKISTLITEFELTETIEISPTFEPKETNKC
ncbi:MAG: DUF4089 domain-containing protein [Pleurocapsa sp.]